MFLDSDFVAARKFIATDPQAQHWHDNLVKQAKEILNEPPATRTLIGPRLLFESRKALVRISLLAALYRIDGNKEYAERARKELLAVSAFTDWHPPHFLDVAEMTNACAIGYDWLYDYLSPKDRQTISSAIINLGLHPALHLLQTHTGFSTLTNNWSQVCNGGISVGALAIADDDPDLSNQILSYCRMAVARPMHTFLAPDGGCIEGPGYWNYANIYTAYYLAALRTALNTDFGFDSSPGLSDGGMFRIQSIGPTGKLFNFADAGENPGIAPEMFYFAKLFNRPIYAQEERNIVANHGDIFDLLWDSQAPHPAQRIEPPLAEMFHGINAAYFRTAWNDRDAIYVGFKGGYNGASHAHLDLGTFVLDALGQRWAFCLGADDYNMPGYFDFKKKRWIYYRLGTLGQNTLVIDNQNQAIAATAPLVAFKSSADASYAVADLTHAYPQADQVRRGVGIFQHGRVLVMDEISLHQPANIVWQMHTRATIDVDGRRAVLHQGGKTLYARILSPAGATFAVTNATAPPPNNPNVGIRKLTVHLHTQGPVRLSILFDIHDSQESMYPQDLEQWVEDSPVK
ncbi:MAG TPA: heparinase II/III family protein [Tepidisphaeraceae bacterium]